MGTAGTIPRLSDTWDQQHIGAPNLWDPLASNLLEKRTDFSTDVRNVNTAKFAVVVPKNQ